MYSCHLLSAVDTPGTKVVIRLQKRFNNIPVSRRDNKRWFLILCETKEERGDVLSGTASHSSQRHPLDPNGPFHLNPFSRTTFMTSPPFPFPQVASAVLFSWPAESVDGSS